MKGKNILSAVLAAVMTAGTVGASALNVPADVEGTRFIEPIQVLRALAIMNGDENGEFRPDDTIIRSEVAKMAVHAMGLEGAAESSKGETKFYDVNTEHWANGYINIATAQGLIEGDGDGNFRPNDPITYAEAMAIMVRATGYTPSADDKGGYPSGYIVVGSGNGLNKNVTGAAGDPISRGNVAYMTVNALECKLMEKTGFGSSAKYEVVDKTLLNDVLNVTRGEGQITAIENTSLGGASNLAAGQIKIGDKVYDTSYNMNNLFGYNVDFFVKESKTDGDVVILAMPKKSENSTLEISADNFLSITSKNSNKAIEYYSGTNTSTKKTAEISDKATLIYNGKYAEMSDELLDLKDQAGGVVLLDTDRDGKYDIVFVTKFYNIVVEEVTQNGKIIDKYGAPVLKLDEDVDFTITKNGQSIEVSELKEYDVLSVAESLDNELFEVNVSNEKVEGKITSISAEGYYIDGKLYKVAANYTEELSIGLEGTFFLDVEGKIAAVDTTAQLSSNYAYLMRANNNTNDETSQFKVFTKAGEETVLTANEKIRFNGKSGVKASDVVNQLRNEANETVRQLITYNTNAAGKITAINTAQDNTSTGAVSSTTFTKNYELKDAVYNESLSKLGNIRVTDSTIIFDIPDNSDEYSIADKSMFENEQKYNAIVYDRNEDFTAKVIVVTNAAFRANAESSVAVVKSVGTAVNKDDIITGQLTAFIDGEEKSILAEEEGILVKGENKPLANGDIIQYKTNAAGEIVSVRVLFDASAKETEFTAEPVENLSIVYGKVTKKFASSINVTVNGGSTLNFDLPSDINVYTVDTTKSKNNIEASVIGDIQAYDEDENNRVFIRLYKDIVQEVVIVK